MTAKEPLKEPLVEITPEEFNRLQINRIKDLYPELRQQSKAPSFALAYAGTYRTLMDSCRFDEDTAKQIEAKYHELYRVSDDWVKDKLEKAAVEGYVTLAFGLKLRTPLLARTINGLSVTPKQALQEARTAGNALSGQSYCLLTTRALTALMEEVWQSKYQLDILPCCAIHDALYFLVRNNADCLLWFNQRLIAHMSWQELSELANEQVHLEAALDVFFPSWANPIELSNDITKEELIQLAAKTKETNKPSSP